ncbi:MAG: MspA family porin [Mycobacterium sp.]
MLFRILAPLATVVAACTLTIPLASADPVTEPADPAVEPVVADAPPPPAPEGLVESSPPAIVTSPDGWTLTVSAKDETQVVSNPLTTAVSSREYIVGGTFNGSLSGPEEDEPPHGTLEVGFQIGCGIDMSTSQGVTMSGSVGFTPSIGLVEDTIFPDVLSPIGGAIAVGLKPGLINIVPVSKKEFTGADPWVMVTGFRIKIDGCVGESFIRSYAFLTRSTDVSDAILGYYGVTKKV